MTLTGYRLAILRGAARDRGQSVDAYGRCQAAATARRELIEWGYISERGGTVYATDAGRAALKSPGGCQ